MNLPASEFDEVKGLFDSVTALISPLQGELANLRLDGVEVSETFPFCLVDVQTGLLTSANAKLCEITGYEAAELVGQPIEKLVPQALKEAHERHRADYAHDPNLRITAMTKANERGVRLRRKDGSEIRVWIGLAPLDGFVAAVILLVER